MDGSRDMCRPLKRYAKVFVSSKAYRTTDNDA